MSDRQGSLEFLTNGRNANAGRDDEDDDDDDDDEDDEDDDDEEVTSSR